MKIAVIAHCRAFHQIQILAVLPNRKHEIGGKENNNSSNNGINNTVFENNIYLSGTQKVERQENVNGHKENRPSISIFQKAEAYDHGKDENDQQSISVVDVRHDEVCNYST